MKMSDFNYDLPDNLIAQNPPPSRGQARLLLLNSLSTKIIDSSYNELHNCLNQGDVLVLNDTKVISARLMVKKIPSGITRELILLEKHGRNDNWHRHKVLYRKALSLNDKLIASDGSELIVTQIIGNGIAVIDSEKDLLSLAESVGKVPLPPYMRRVATKNDRQRYQTVWADKIGSVAAPTASLNMTFQQLEALNQKGVIICYATLHVGLGTFLPIRTTNVEQHTMHNEYFEIPVSTIKNIQTAKKSGNRIIALGTTMARTLEYAAHDILHKVPQNISGEANIFIYPGYTFKVVDCLITNFHAPRSTVLMLTAAFAGWNNLLKAYNHAIEQEYRFLSYGDSMFINNQAQT